MLKPCSFRGKLCFAPSSGQRVRFTRPDHWLHGQDRSDPGDPLADVTRRYLGAYGPVTREDYARWWGHSPAVAAKLISGLGDEVTEVSINGGRLWLLSDDAQAAQHAQPPRRVRLLPAFDPWVVGASRDVPDLVADGGRERIYRQQGWISPVLLVDGRMDGIWSYELKGSRCAVRIEPFVKPPKWAREAAEVEAAALAGFLGAPLKLSWS
jgi:hypothetical protein